MVDPKVRKKEFAKLDPKVVKRACKGPNYHTQGIPAVLKKVSFTGKYGYDTSIGRFRAFAMAKSAKYFGMGDEKVAKDLIEAFKIWAAADALKLSNFQTNSVYSLKLVLVLLLSSWSIIQDHPASNCQNHRYLRDAINMQWGILTNDQRRF